MHSVPITGQLNGGVEIAQKWIVPCSAFNKLCSTGKSPQLFEPVLYQVQNGGNYSHSSLKIAVRVRRR